jgi:hypothetical protein
LGHFEISQFYLLYDAANLVQFFSEIQQIFPYLQGKIGYWLISGFVMNALLQILYSEEQQQGESRAVHRAGIMGYKSQ